MLGEPALGNLIFPVWPLVLILWSKCSPSRTPSPAELGSGCCQCSKWFIQVDTAAPSVQLARASPYPGHLVPMGHPRVEASVST